MTPHERTKEKQGDKQKKVYLQQYQKDAYKQFKKTGYVLVDAYRRAGKTELLKAIIMSENINDIGIFTLSYAMFKHEYGKFFSPLGRIYMNFDKRILLCDEFIMSPIEGKKIACVTTGFPNVTKWKLGENKFIEPKELKIIKKALTKTAYKTYFGNYE